MDYEESLLTSHQQHQSLHSIFDKNDHQALIREAHLQRTSLGVELDESDSQFTYSNSSSPQFQGHDQDSSTITTAGDKKNEEIEENDEENINKFSPKVQIIAASGDNIIAVANPALALSSALIPISHSSSSSSTSLRRNDKEN